MTHPPSRRARIFGRIRSITEPIVLLALCFAPLRVRAQQQLPSPQNAQQAVQQQEQLSLAQALQMAERRNLDLMAARAQRAVAAAGVKIAGERPNPTANVTVLRDDPHEGWWVDWPIELGAKRKKRIELAKEQTGLTEDDIVALERQTRMSVRDAFFSLLFARGVTSAKSDALALAQRLRDIAQTRYETGDVPQLEVFQADLALSQAKADQQVARQEERVALSDFNALLNEPPATDWNLVTPLDSLPAEPALSDLLARAVNSNSDLQRISQQERVQQAQRALFQAQKIPNLTLSLGMDYNSPHNFRYGPRSQASMEVPIFSHYQGEIAESSATLTALADQEAATRRAVEGRVESSYLQLASRETQARLYRDSLVPSAENLAELAEESYQAGKTSILSVIEAQKSVQQVKEQYLQSLFAVHQAFAQLEAVVGTAFD